MMRNFTFCIFLSSFLFFSLSLYGQTDSPFTSWGIDASSSKGHIQLDLALKKFRPKREVVVAVIDTGIDFNHPFLKGNVMNMQGPANSQDYGVDFSVKGKVGTSPHDEHGHGTHVAGIIKSVFAQVKILPLKYYGPQNSGQENLNATIKALEYAVNANVDIINYSGGGPEPSTEELRILKIAEQKGILVVAAAGNEHSNIDDEKNAYYPASYKLTNILTVTAYDQEMQILPSSNWGREGVDVAAPGYKIRSSLPYGRSGTMTGTSQATAFASGVAALLKSQYPTLSASALRKIIMNSVQKTETLKEKCSTEGMINASQAIDLARVVEAQPDKGLVGTTLPEAPLRPGQILLNKPL